LHLKGFSEWARRGGAVGLAEWVAALQIARRLQGRGLQNADVIENNFPEQAVRAGRS